MKLYVDFFRVIPPSPRQKFHGGGNYARNIIFDIIQNNYDIDIIILCPMSYNPTKENEPVFYNNRKIIWERIQQLSQFCNYDGESILWSPILHKLEDFKTLIAIKKEYPNMKVCATVHDLRTLDFVWDHTERYYFCGVKKFFFPLYKLVFVGIASQLLKKPVIKKSLSVLDEVYTVSNFAMQDIINLNSKSNVSWYYQSSIFNYIKCERKRNNNQYVLFVSGERRLKNFGHALIGFSKFKKTHPESKLKLVVTGISDQTYKNICKIPKISLELIKTDVICYEYVSNEKLGELYSNCRFALYTSKMEGFGLPVIEAAIYGKTSIVSNVTSIPEVIGSAVRYVYPQNDSAIAHEIEYLCDDRNLNKYENRVKEAMIIIKQRMKLEENNFIEDLLEMKKI